MCGIELDRRISIIVDVGRYITGGPTTTIGIHRYLWVCIDIDRYVCVYMGMYGYVMYGYIWVYMVI